jgi:hypothetical protein
METLRDAPFGQACRLFSRWRLFPYPEEVDSAYAEECLESRPEAEEQERIAREADSAIGSGQNYSTYTLTSQISRARSVASLNPDDSGTSTKAADHDLEKSKDIQIVGWAGPNDPEVKIPLTISILTTY